MGIWVWGTAEKQVEYGSFFWGNTWKGISFGHGLSWGGIDTFYLACTLESPRGFCPTGPTWQVTLRCKGSIHPSVRLLRSVWNLLLALWQVKQSEQGNLTHIRSTGCERNMKDQSRQQGSSSHHNIQLQRLLRFNPRQTIHILRIVPELPIPPTGL